MSEPRTIIVFASTGLQGSALISALTAGNGSTSKWRILALTRNEASESAQKLARLPGVDVRQVAKDHMENPAQCFELLGLKKGEIYGVFSNQGYVDDKTMVRQGKAIADASKAWGVQHLVYSSTDNGDMEDCGISAFEVKREVERHIESIGIPSTFLRPVQFMEVFMPDAPFIFKMGRTVTMRYTFNENPNGRHQLVSSIDIGRAGAKAFTEGPAWKNGKVSLAGDSLTVKEIDQIFREELGEPVQLTYGLLARFVRANVPIVNAMSKFFGQHGYKVDIEALRQEIPELEDLRTFLRRWKVETSKA